MIRTALLCAGLALGGYASASWLTHDFQVWTAEGARRLEVALRPVDTPDVQVDGPGIARQPLDRLLADGRSVTVVDFVYTRCQTVCLSLGGVLQQMQAALGQDDAANRTAPVKLLSISFDGSHDDPEVLQRYAARLNADADLWRFVRMPDVRDTQRLLDAFQVVVVPDGRGDLRTQRRPAGGGPAGTAGARVRHGRAAARTGLRSPPGRRGAAMSSARRGAAAAAALLCVLALPPVRGALEATMSRHMLVQYTLLAGCGFVLAGAFPPRWRAAADRWNDHGIAGLFGAALGLAVLMIPRVLDLALVDARVEAAKWIALLGCGAALRLSWRRAGLVVQGFFLGNVLPMTAVAGFLFQDATVRLCNAYLLDDQVRLGQWLVGIAAFAAAAWFAQVVRTLMRREGAALVTAPASPGSR